VHETCEQCRANEHRRRRRAKQHPAGRTRHIDAQRRQSDKWRRAQKTGRARSSRLERTAVDAPSKVGVEEGALELGELAVDAQRRPKAGAGAQLST
jgi:hypothetical protein